MMTLLILVIFLSLGAAVLGAPNGTCVPRAPSPTMSRTVTNPVARGLVEALSVPAELRARRDGRPYAAAAGVVPIHCCSPHETATLSQSTHHYCDVFTDCVLAPLGELAYVRIDDDTAEKVFINRTKRILIVSSDGRLAQWRAAPTFESANCFVAGAPIVNKDGALVSLVTAKRGNHYAVSSFEGDGGYFETPIAWKILEPPEGSLIYGDRWFATREELRDYIAALPEGHGDAPPTPVLLVGTHPRIALVGSNGRQLAHYYLQGVLANNVEYL